MLDSPVGWAMLMGLGGLTGTLSGLLGIGGGLLMVPALTLFGIPLVEATATSLVGVLLSSGSGSWQNFRAGELNWRLSLLLAGFGIPTTQLGAWLDAVLSLAFAALLATLYLMQLRQQLQMAQTPGPKGLPLNLTTGVGLLAGLLSGLFGVGGGMVMVPLQMLLGEPVKAAVRTSLGAIVAIGVSGLIQHAWNGNVLWVPGICLGLGGSLGAQLGTRLLPRLADRTVNSLFRAFAIGLAIYMGARGVRGIQD